MAFERIFIASVEQSNAINAAADKGCNRLSMAGFYTDCIIADEQARRRGTARINWLAVNLAIIARWPKGLAYIKKLAYKKFLVVLHKQTDDPAKASVK